MHLCGSARAIEEGPKGGAVENRHHSLMKQSPERLNDIKWIGAKHFNDPIYKTAH